MADLVLASRSPQRRAILEQLGITFEVVEPEIDEVAHGHPNEMVLENALRKARHGFAETGKLTLGVDTDVVFENRLLGKAADDGEARIHLERLSGVTHSVLSGLALCDPEGKRSGVEESKVTFRELDGELIERYVASGEWRERAGAYAIQGLGSALVERVENDVANVIGLPVRLLLELAPELFPAES